MTYNMTDFNTANNLFDFYSAINTASGNYLVDFSMLMFFFLICIILLPNNPPGESILAASFAALMVSLLFFAMNLCTQQWPIGFGIIASISAVFIVITR